MINTSLVSAHLNQIKHAGNRVFEDASARLTWATDVNEIKVLKTIRSLCIACADDYDLALAALETEAPPHLHLVANLERDDKLSVVANHRGA